LEFVLFGLSSIYRSITREQQNDAFSFP